MRELSFQEQQIDITFLRVVMYAIIKSLTWYVQSKKMCSKATTFPLISVFSFKILDSLSSAKSLRFPKINYKCIIANGRPELLISLKLSSCGLV